MRSLHAVNLLRTDYIAHGTKLRDQRVLDVGCGAGLLSEALAKRGAHVTGIDLASHLLDAARAHACGQELEIRYYCLSAEQLAQQQPASFDLICCMEVLEHIPNPESVVSACSRLLKPGGEAYFSTIDRSARAFLCVILGAEYVLHLLPIGSHRYQMLIRPSELLHWATRYGFERRRDASVTFNLLTRQFRLVPRVDMNYIIHFRNSHAPHRLLH